MESLYCTLPPASNPRFAAPAGLRPPSGYKDRRLAGRSARAVPLPLEARVVARVIFAFNGDLESRLALHRLVHERGLEVLTLSINLGQEIYLEPIGEVALELGATAAQVIDRREMFLRDFALPVLHADAVYQSSCFLGSALARYLIAQELVRAAREEGCD